MFSVKYELLLRRLSLPAVRRDRAATSPARECGGCVATPGATIHGAAVTRTICVLCGITLPSSFYVGGGGGGAGSIPSA